eukprot:11398.XXX_49_234_1 [CDS] Oithona nana genome sequencing.
MSTMVKSGFSTSLVWTGEDASRKIVRFAVTFPSVASSPILSGIISSIRATSMFQLYDIILK